MGTFSGGQIAARDVEKPRQDADNLQSKYSKIQATNSKIPVKRRQVSVPVHQLDESNLTNIKRSAIPRIISSPLVSNGIITKASISPVVRKVATPFYTPETKTHTSMDTPLSTVTKLSRDLASLSLDSPIARVAPREMGTSIKPDRKTYRVDATEVTPAAKILRSTTSSYLQPKSSALLNVGGKNHASLETNTVKNKLISSEKPKGPISPRLVGPSIRHSSIPKSRIFSESRAYKDSPLISRLTRSTTSSDLKSIALGQKGVLDSDNNPPARKLRTVSESIRPLPRATKSSRLKQQASSSKLQERGTIPASKNNNHESGSNPNLIVPKKRSRMVKSYTVSTGLDELVQQHPVILKKVNREPSRQRVSSSHGAGSTQHNKPNITTGDQLFQLLRLRVDLTNWNKADGISKGVIKTSTEVIKTAKLSSYEKAEVMKRKEVYYLGNMEKEKQIPTSSINNFGFDDLKKNLIVNSHDHIQYRYEVIGPLGTGMFGNVYKCYDHKSKAVVSIKLMKNDINWSLQSINEIKILTQLHQENILRYISHFNFRSHICIVSELLCVDLFQVLEATRDHQISLNVIKNWSRQLLNALNFMHKQNVIHADLKPENIMLVDPNGFKIKIIDFGSSSHVGNISYPYIQSRFYRAPEVLLGSRYNTKIDIWSFACVIYELYTGVPLFQAKNEIHLFNLVVKIIGLPSPRTVLKLRDPVLKYGSVTKNSALRYIDKESMIFTRFDRLGNFKQKIEDSRIDLSKLADLNNSEFSDFLESILTWDYFERPDASTLLQHEFLV